jgi:lysophospholipase L1-like esterase
MTRRTPSWRPLALAAGLALLVLTAGACSSPEGPSQQPGPTLTCPSDVSAVSNDGNPVGVTYPVPSAVGGTTPVTVACAPPSGSSFKTGSSPVTCTATDASARTATCSFAVKVSVPPRLTLTKFMAFGDSLTEGKPSRLYPFDDFPGSYPSVLYSSMVARYAGQALTMSKQGLGGETTSAGLTRLTSLLKTQPPEVLLLMEGSNDLSGGDSTAIPLAVRNIEQMVVNAKAAGAYVFLATIPPQVPGSTSGKGYQIVPTYNGEIRKIAVRQNAPLVEIEDALEANLAGYFGADGLHCTTAGYQKMADTFLAAIARPPLETPAVIPSAGTWAPLGMRIDEDATANAGLPNVAHTGLKPRATGDGPAARRPRGR